MIIEAEIKGDTAVEIVRQSNNARKTESDKHALIEKLDAEAAEGVIEYVPKGMTQKHRVSFFPVAKKNAVTGQIEMCSGSIRVVADCKRRK